jgi:hypothetical protein
VDPAARAEWVECTKPSGSSRRVVFKGVPVYRNALFYDPTSYIQMIYPKMPDLSDVPVRVPRSRMGELLREVIACPRALA